jgi:dual-specificity kinase
VSPRRVPARRAVRAGPSLYSALKARRRQLERAPDAKRHSSRRGRCFSLAQIAAVGADCFGALAHLHGLGLAHTDLNPENVLFTLDAARRGLDAAAIRVALIDFGGATWEDDGRPSSIVCTRQYRPPEVTLGTGWRREVDLWSMGCILAELWTGELLFQTHDEVEHLALMERLLGTLPRRMLKAVTTRRLERALRHGELRWPDRAADRESEAHVRSQPRLRDAVERGSCEPAERPQLARLTGLVRELLEFKPELRLSAADALHHPFIAEHGIFGHAPGNGVNGNGVSNNGAGANGAHLPHSPPMGPLNAPVPA